MSGYYYVSIITWLAIITCLLLPVYYYLAGMSASYTAF